MFSILFAALLNTSVISNITLTNVVTVNNLKPVSFQLESTPLGFFPDGQAGWLVVVKPVDRYGRPAVLPYYNRVSFKTSRGVLLRQSYGRYGNPAAIVYTDTEGPIKMTVRVLRPNYGTKTVQTDTKNWEQPKFLAKALGPRLVEIGWFPKKNGPIQVERFLEDGSKTNLGVITGLSSFYRDASVLPGKNYHYNIAFKNGSNFIISNVSVPSEPVKSTVSNIIGKGFWLSFSSDPKSSIYWGKFKPAEIVDQAVQAGLKYVELRFCYGAFWQVTPEAKPVIDAIVDGLAAKGISTLGWTVPRLYNTDDLQTAIQTAYYQTSKGTHLGGLAVDLERGNEYMPYRLTGKYGPALYMQTLRQALGTNTLLVATVEDPYLMKQDNRHYPYSMIASNSDVMQPMTYWRSMGRTPSGFFATQKAVANSFEKLLNLSGTNTLISMGGQTMPGRKGKFPPPEEINACLVTASNLGAVGVCFYDWMPSRPDQWKAIADFDW